MMVHEEDAVFADRAVMRAYGLHVVAFEAFPMGSGSQSREGKVSEAFETGYFI